MSEIFLDFFNKIFNTQQPKKHKVKSGDTPYSIAKANGVSVDDLLKANKLNGNTLSIGALLTIPSKSDKPQNPQSKEISMMPEISDEALTLNATRKKHINITKHPDYKIKKGDSPATLAKKFDVEERAILLVNGMDKDAATKIQINEVVKIPPSRHAKNINNLSDAANAMGVSTDFIKRLKSIEDGIKDDGKPFKDNEFHNKPYVDDEGNRTIGIGHVLKSGEKQSLTSKEVLQLFVNDMLKMEENLWSVMGSKKGFDKLPPSIKEALIDMTFNKGTAIIEKTPGLTYALKQGKYEAAINLMTNNKSQKGREMSGLSKRRLFDISVAAKMYKGNPPQSVINTTQKVYNRGIELLRIESAAAYKKIKNPKITAQQYFINQLTGYNKEALEFSGGKIKVISK